MEVRLGKRQKLKQVLKACGTQIEPTFASMFQLEIAQKVLGFYLASIEQKYPAILHYQYNDPKRFLDDFYWQTQQDVLIMPSNMWVCEHYSIKWCACTASNARPTPSISLA
jgi:hypothetical protein